MLEKQNIDIVNKFNDFMKISQKLDNLNYNEYKRVGVDYFATTKDHLNNLTKGLEDFAVTKKNVKIANEFITMHRMVSNLASRIKDISSRESENISDKLFNIEKNNKNIIRYQKGHIDVIDRYLSYFNYAYGFKKAPLSELEVKGSIEKLKNILKLQYMGDMKVYNSLIKNYEYLDKESALVSYIILKYFLGNLQ